MTFEWMDAKVELPNDGKPVLVLYEGHYAIGWRKNSPTLLSPGAWLLHLGGKTFSPYPSKHPRWWAPLPAAPEVEPLVSPATEGEEVVFWRKSVSDLFTDVRSLLDTDELWKQFLTLADRHRPSEAPPVIEMLLWCPECSERHVDEGQWAVNRHHTHACQHCGHVWRPAVECTRGVRFLPGFRNLADRKPTTGKDPAHG